MTDSILNTRFSLGTDLSALDDLETALHKFNQSAHLLPKDLFQIRLILDELTTNTVSYGFSSGIGSGITIDISLNRNGKCDIVYTDDAPAFNPLDSIVPEDKRSTEEANYGGFGISFVAKIMDEVNYAHENGKNIIRMTKKLAKP